MKTIDTTQETATAWSPWKVESKEFIQKAYTEQDAAIIKALVTSNLGTYSLTVPYVIEGCVLSNVNRDLSAGVIFYGGKFYNVSSITGGTAPLEFQLESTYDGTADPTQFSDSTTHYIHLDYHFTTYAAGAAPSPTFNATAFKSVYKATKLYVQVNDGTQTTTSTSFVNLGTSSYTTPNDGVTRVWEINAKSVIKWNPSTGATYVGGGIAIYDGTSVLDESYSFLDRPNTVTNVLLTASCIVRKSIAPNTTITMQMKSSGGGSTEFQLNSFSMVEL